MEARRFVGALLASPTLTGLQETPRHAEVARDVARSLPALAGNVVHDLHTVALIEEHGVRVLCIRDTGFHRFPVLEVVDPLL